MYLILWITDRQTTHIISMSLLLLLILTNIPSVQPTIFVYSSACSLAIIEITLHHLHTCVAHVWIHIMCKANKINYNADTVTKYNAYLLS